MTSVQEVAFLSQAENAAAVSSDPSTKRTSRERTMQDDEGRATVELASIMIATSTTVSAGPSSPPLEQHKPSGIIPPARPSSTPFPHTEPRSSHIVCLGCPDDTAMTDLASATNLAVTSTDSCGPLITLNLNDLPAEIHECILDHLFGYRVSTTSKSSVGMSSWGTALRHSRRKELSRLALVSRVWRDLIQERLYRHIKLKATVESINCAIEYFAEHPRLRPYVKHMEIWFPVFQPKYGPPSANSAQILPTLTIDGLSNTSYTLPADNCTLDEAFYFVGATFPEVCVMTLEGGERKKAPQVKHFISEASPRGLPKIRAIRTLILKGQWNLARVDTDFNNILAALPSLQEWHGSYSKPKSKSYISMATVLPTLSQGLKHLNLCLEGDYRREMSSPPYFMKVAEKLHFCSKLAEAVRNLEYLSYTGRVCRTFFDMAAKLVDPRSCKVKSIDLTVKNCCRPLMQWGDSGSGITDANFINAFESLVLAGIRSLDRLKSVKYLRIRYVDLDSPVPPLNPYFMLKDGWCSGVWSDTIISELARVRPDARFEDMSESFGEVSINKEGRMIISPEFPRSRVLSLKLSNYALLSGGVSIT